MKSCGAIAALDSLNLVKLQMRLVLVILPAQEGPSQFDGFSISRQKCAAVSTYCQVGFEGRTLGEAQIIC